MSNPDSSKKPQMIRFSDMKRSTNGDEPFTIDASVTELALLGVQQWKCLCDAIQASESLEKISMLEPINEESSKAMYEALKGHQSVDTLLWQDISTLDTANARWLAKLIEETSLAWLDLIGKSIKDTKMPETIMSALNASRSIMWLTIDRVGFTRAARINDLMVSNSSIVKLVLSRNHMDAEQFIALCEGLKHNRSIRVLDVSHNSVGDEGMRVLSEVLKKNMTLRTLNMTVLNYTASGLQYLGAALKQNCVLKTLKLGEAYDLDDGAQFIGDSLQVNESLTSLTIHETFSSPGMEVIAGGIKFNRFLMDLEFSGKKFDNKCLESVADALKVNTNVEYLGFKTNDISGEGVNALISMVEHNQSLTALDMTYLPIGQSTAEGLLQALEKNVSLLSVETRMGSSKAYATLNTKLAELMERNVLLQYERTLDMLVLFFNVARNPITFPKDIWRLIFCSYKTPGVPTFEPLLNDIFQDHSIRRVPAISKF